MSDVKKLEQARGVKNVPWKSGSVVWFGALKKNKKIRVGCPVPAVAGKEAGWVLWAMDLKNIKSMPGWAAQKFFFFEWCCQDSNPESFDMKSNELNH